MGFLGVPLAARVLGAMLAVEVVEKCQCIIHVSSLVVLGDGRLKVEVINCLVNRALNRSG